MSEERFSVELVIPVRFRDLDGFQHVNNAVFATYLEMAREAYWRRVHGLESEIPVGGYDAGASAFLLARVEIDFLAPIPYGVGVRALIRATRLGTKSWDFAYRLEPLAGGAPFARAHSVQVAYDFARAQAVPLSPFLRRRITEIEGWPAEEAGAG